MSSGNPSSSTDGKSPTPYVQHGQNTGNLYSFSVHQPYTNWPLHASHSTPYAPSWYAHPAHQYNLQRSYRNQGIQASPEKNEGSRDAGRKYLNHWDPLFVTFFKRLGLQQTLAGFHEDTLLLSEDWECKEVPGALKALAQDLSDLIKSIEGDKSNLQQESLEERKLEHIQFQNGVEKQTPSSTVKSVSEFLRQSRRRNNASNRAEFLLNVAEKRRRLNELGESSAEPGTEGTSERKDSTADMDVDATIASCARTDAKYQDRDTQIKYDIAKNEDGPLRRTMKRGQDDGESPQMSTQPSLTAGSWDGLHANSHPGITARMESIEEHLAVRYVPSRPRSLFDRLKVLEDYIIRLEKDYPPWAALHFNQPNRGWPPPPRSIPIIIPPHLASSDSSVFPSETGTARARGTTSSDSGQPSSAKLASGTKGKSSLHRAVMERLEIQKAMGDLAGGGSTSFSGA